MPKEPVALATVDPTAARLAALKALYPDALADGKFDFDKLRGLLGDAVAPGPERFTFSWAGRTDAAAMLQTPSRAALVPQPAASVNWDATRNLFIEGDNLEVLKLLYKPYAGKVKLIYIDPPYNTGQDFVYPDDFADPLAVYLKLTGQADEAGKLLTGNPETSGRYHSAWLSMMYPRLFLARQLLRDDGVIFVSIDDHEVHHLRLLMNEVFGEENFVECFSWKRSYGGGAKEKYAVSQHEYIMMFCRSMEDLPELWLPSDPAVEKKYYKYTDSKATIRGPYRLQPLEAGKSMDERPNLVFPIEMPDGRQVTPKRQWLWNRERVKAAIEADELVFSEKNGDTTVNYKQYLINENGEKRGAKPASVIEGIYTQHGTQELDALLETDSPFQFPKPSRLLKFLIQFACDNEGIVLDFFSGSGTTAQAVLELNREDGGNRRFILVQLPEPTGNKTYPTIAEIGKERIRRVIAKLNKETPNILGKMGTAREGGGGEDLGFRVFSLSESHFEQWAGIADRDGAAYANTMDAFRDPLKPDADPVAVLWELAVKHGFGLNSTISQSTAGTNTIWTVTDPEKDPAQSFRACFDRELIPDIARELELGENDVFVCRDTALSDSLSTNLSLQCRLKTF